MKRIFLASVAVLTVAAFAPMAANANIIGGLVNTGAGLTDGQIDPNYAVVQVPTVDGPSTQAVAVVGGGFPFGYWVVPATTPDANWISAEGRDPNLDPNLDGTYEYQLRFFLPSNATSLTISGNWAADNRGSDITLNGVSSGETTGPVGANGYTELTSFVISGTGNAGWNDLDFDTVNFAQNGGNPTGLLVTDITGFYTPGDIVAHSVIAAPEPASIAILGAGLLGIGVIRRKRA
jgi:hypothetical protein